MLALHLRFQEVFLLTEGELEIHEGAFYGAASMDVYDN